MGKSGWILFKILFVALGIILIIGGVKLQESIDNFMEKAYETVGTVEYVETETIREEDPKTGEITYDTKYHVHISYVANDENEYSKIIETSNRSYYRGDKISIFYDPSNPRNSKTNEETNGGTVMSIFGGCFLIVGIVIMFSDVIQKRKDISYSNYNNDDTNNY